MVRAWKLFQGDRSARVTASTNSSANHSCFTTVVYDSLAAAAHCSSAAIGDMIARKRYCPVPTAVACLILTTALLCGGVVKAQDPAFLAQLDKQLAADKQEDGRSAKQFCSSPDFRKMTCGFASDAEVEATIKKQCPLCGTLYRNLPDKLPAEVTGVDRYNQWGIRLISLACKGPVVVRSVFKILEEPPVKQQPGWEGTNCTNSALVQVDDKSVSEGGQASEVVRCELQLGTSGGSEVERALAAKEGRCWQCGLCSTGKGCPSNKGTWYSDTYTTVARGCSFDPQQGYEYHRSGININPFTKILLAKYEVCNSPGCFNAEAEQAKIKAAKACVKGKCAA